MKSQMFLFVSLIILSINLFIYCQNQKNIKNVTFERSSQNFGYQSTFQIALADLDNDGDLDAVFSNNEYIGSKVYFNDGKGYFEESEQLLNQEGHGAALADLNRDGDIDILMTCASIERKSILYLNNGKGFFPDARQDINDMDLSGIGIYLHDIDCDGDLDAMIDYYHEKNKIYLNNGEGIFSDSEKYYPEDSFWADLDSDNDIDIFECEDGKGYRTWLNDGSGNFTEYSFIADGSLIRGFVGFGDLDNDNDIDIVVTNGKREKALPTKILLNDGKGKFIKSKLELSAVYHGRVGIGDLNNDGNNDIVLTSHQLLNQIYLSDGKGAFIKSEFGTTKDGGYMAPLLEDINEDGYLDIIIPNYITGSNEIWFNKTK